MQSIPGSGLLVLLLLVSTGPFASPARADGEVVRIETEAGTLTATQWAASGEASTSVLLLTACDQEPVALAEVGKSLAAAGLRALALTAETGEQGLAQAKAAHAHLGDVTGILGVGCGGSHALALALEDPAIAQVITVGSHLSALDERNAYNLPLDQELLLIVSKEDGPAFGAAGTIAYRRRSASTIERIEGAARGSELLQNEEVAAMIEQWLTP